MPVNHLPIGLLTLLTFRLECIAATRVRHLLPYLFIIGWALKIFLTVVTHSLRYLDWLVWFQDRRLPFGM